MPCKARVGGLENGFHFPSGSLAAGLQRTDRRFRGQAGCQ